MATGTPSDVKTAEPDVSIDLPAPADGWKKKFIPKKGATPGKGEVVFIAPDGEEIKTKTQLRNYLKDYLKSHPAAGITAKNFDWSTGDTPRRSSRLSGKSKASESPENETPEKKQRKSSSKKATKEKGDGNEDEATPEGSKEAPEDSNVDAQDTVELCDKDVVTEKDAAEDPVKGGDVGEPAAEEEKAAAEGHEAAPEEQKTDAMEVEAAGEEHKSDDVKEQEAAAAAEEEEKSDAVEEQQDAVAVEEQKKSEDVQEQVASADVIEEAVDMDVLLGTDDNEATDAVNEDVQLEIGDGVTDKKKEGDQVSDSSKQSNGGGEEKGVENASVPSQVSEEWPISEQGPSDFLESLPADFLTNPFTQPSTQVMNHPTKAEETADPVGGGEAHKESLSKAEAGNQTSVAAGDDDTGIQKGNIEEKKQEDP